MSTDDSGQETHRTYRVTLNPNAAKALDTLDNKIFEQIDRRILELETDPRPANSRKLAGPPHNLYRIRSGRFRIVYSVNDTERTVLIVTVRKRNESTYKDL